MWALSLVVIFCLTAAGVRGDEVRSADSGILDGDRKSLVVVGYSTSFIWPSMLQFMLDRHAGKPGVYYVLNGAVGGSPVVDWLEGQVKYERTYGRLLKAYLAKGAGKLGSRPVPTVALCQQSLQGAFGDRRSGIRGSDDAERIQIGSDTFLDLAEQLRCDSIETVYIAAHIYKKPMEPEIGNERIALSALMDRGIPYIRQGPDLWEPTKAVYPDGFSPADKVHPNIKGARIMAEGWYRSLAGDDVNETVIHAMYAEAFPALRKAEEKREAGRVKRLERRRKRQNP